MQICKLKGMNVYAYLCPIETANQSYHEKAQAISIYDRVAFRQPCKEIGQLVSTS